MWISTDKMIYHLNNVRKRGQGGRRYEDLEDKQFPTSIVVSTDMHTRYVFRADVCYDWNIRLEDIEEDTKLYKDDHLNDFVRKNARLRVSYALNLPQPMTLKPMRSIYENLKNSTEEATILMVCM